MHNVYKGNKRLLEGLESLKNYEKDTFSSISASIISLSVLVPPQVLSFGAQMRL